MAKLKLTPALKKRALQFARMGFSDTAIAKSVGISRTTLYSSKYADLLNSISKARDKAKTEVFNDLVARSKSDATATASVFLAERLKVFNLPTYRLKKPKNAKDALENIAKIIEDYGDGLVDEARATKLISFNQAYLKAHETNEIEKKLEELLEKFENE